MNRVASIAIVLMVSGQGAEAGEPALCDDQSVQDKIAFQYQMSEATRDVSVNLSDVKEVQDMGVGEPPEDANFHATASARVEVSRYCEGQADIGGDDPDPIFWRIDIRSDDRDFLHVDHCSLRHDTFEDGCVGYRPAE